MVHLHVFDESFSVPEGYQTQSPPEAPLTSQLCLDESVEASPYTSISGQSPPMLVTPQHPITSSPKSPPTFQVCQFNMQLQPHMPLQRATIWCGFVIVGDNIDKSVNACHQTMECRNRSLHYFNSYAVKDRCGLPEFASPIDRSSYNMNCLLPSNDDFEAILLHFAVLVGRMRGMSIVLLENYVFMYIKVLWKRL